MIETRSRKRLRLALLLSSWTWWIAVPAAALSVPGGFMDKHLMEEAVFLLASLLICIGIIAWLAVVTHAVRTMFGKPIRIAWVIALLLFGAFASPFYVMIEIPREQTGEQDASAS